MSNVKIIGSGMAGFGAAYRLHQEGVRGTIYEKNNFHGGHTASFRFEEKYTFDEGPHISFTSNERIQELLADSVGNAFQRVQSKVNNYWKGYWIKHPAQCNLYGLPVDLVERCILDFIEVSHAKPVGRPSNYEEWLIASFGETFARTFPMQYGKKYHTAEAKNMNTNWLGPRLYRPSLKEFINGALSPSTPDFHYVDRFRYPTHGGFVSYLNKFLDMGDLCLDHQVVSIDAEEKQMQFSNGEITNYDNLISSMPLPDLIESLKNVPADVKNAASRLACTSCYIVNVVIDREDISDAQWSYFYDDDIVFTRLAYPHMQSPNNVPSKCGSIQAEIYFSKKYKPLSDHPSNYIPRVINDLRKCGLLKDDDEILFSNAWLMPYANVIFDLDHQCATEVVRSYLSDIGIYTCGRYGEWGYLWTDDSFVSGENAAQQVLNAITSI